MVTTSSLVAIGGLLVTILVVLIISFVAITREIFSKDFNFLSNILCGVLRLFF